MQHITWLLTQLLIPDDLQPNCYVDNNIYDKNKNATNNINNNNRNNKGGHYQFNKKDKRVLDLSRPHTVQFPTILQSVKTLNINTHLSPLNTENSMIPVLPAASLLDCPSLSPRPTTISFLLSLALFPFSFYLFSRVNVTERDSKCCCITHSTEERERKSLWEKK